MSPAPLDSRAMCPCLPASTICYVAAAEQFPTTCRSIGVGYGASCGRFGSIGSPFILLLPNAQLALALVCLAAMACAWGLSETQGQAISDAIEDDTPPEDQGRGGGGGIVVHGVADRVAAPCHAPCAASAPSAQARCL